MPEKSIPKAFLNWAFHERKELIRRMLEGKVSREELFLGFLRHTPAVVTCGSAGVNASVKGVGFLHKQERLPDTLRKLREFMLQERKPEEALKFLLEHIYVEEKIDFSKLTSIELAKRHTWTNIQEKPEATLIFYYPPTVSFEVRCDVEVHLSGDVHEFVHRIHDLYHGGRPRQEAWKDRPVYVFRIREIYDNSPSKMGERIY